MRQHLDMPVPPLASRRQGLPTGFEDVVQTALAKDPDSRYRHAGEFKAALEAATRHAPDLSSPSRTNLASAGIAITTDPHLGQTYRVPRAEPRPPEPPRGKTVPALIALVLVLVVLLTGAVGYIAAGGRLNIVTSAATPTTVAAATQAPAPAAQPSATQIVAAPTQPAPPTQPPAPTATAPPPKVVNPEPTPAPPTATVPAPPTPTPPPPPTATPRSAVVQPTVPAKVPPSTDPRLALVERHVADYFTALNAGDYARAHTVCCTPAWRAKNPLAEWQRNFSGVTDLRFATPFRYPTVEASRIIAEVDYSFLNSSGARQFFMLRWTFVPSGNDWLADEAVASRQR